MILPDVSPTTRTLVARALGDRVTTWNLFNEPAAFTTLGYLDGTHAPGRQGITDFLRATHTVNLAQGAAFRALKATRPNSRVGTAFSMSPCEPASSSEDDQLAAERAHAIINLWFLEPALLGKYPNAFPFSPATFMRIQQFDMDNIRAPLDFIGINLYYRTMISAPTLGERLSNSRYFFLPARMTAGTKGPRTDFEWEVWPEALYSMIMRITRDYNRPAIEVTESGCSYGDAPDANGIVNDKRRSRLLPVLSRGDGSRRYKTAPTFADITPGACSTISNGPKGYSQRFGLVYVDFKTQKRTIKESGKWYAKLAAANAIPS